MDYYEISTSIMASVEAEIQKLREEFDRKLALQEAEIDRLGGLVLQLSLRVEDLEPE